jgi:hypothetical protein
MPSQLKPYSVLQFKEDVAGAFRFLENDYGFVKDSSTWTSHRSDMSMREHVSTGMPHVKYSASMREVSIAHDPRGAVEVIARIEFPDFQSVTVQELAAAAGDPSPGRFGEIYDMTRSTAGERIRMLAEGLQRYGAEVLRELEAP